MIIRLYFQRNNLAAATGQPGMGVGGGEGAVALEKRAKVGHEWPPVVCCCFWVAPSATELDERRRDLYAGAFRAYQDAAESLTPQRGACR
jgi:hypothetical protein